MWNLKTKQTRRLVVVRSSGVEEVGEGGQTLSYKMITFTAVTVANDTVWHTCKLLSTDLRSSHHTHPHSQGR